MARAQVENALTKVKNDVVAVVCANDGTAYGAIQALQAQGLAGKVFVNGVDAEPHAQELIKQGLMTLSNFTDFWQSGVEAGRGAQARQGREDRDRLHRQQRAQGRALDQGRQLQHQQGQHRRGGPKKYPWWFATSAIN